MPQHSGGRRLTFALGTAQLLAWGSSYYLLASIGRPMALDLGLPPGWVYASFSAALLVGAALGPRVGRLIDQRGGRPVLLASNLAFALALLVLGLAPNGPLLTLGWLLLGAAMPLGLYDAAFATMVRLRGTDARSGIVGITLIAGFASSVSWPVSALIESQFGWRMVCVFWAVMHLTLGLLIHARWVPHYRPVPRQTPPPHAATAPPPAVHRPALLWLLAAGFTASGFVFASMATHLPQLPIASGVLPAAAVAAASLVGIAQVVARLIEAGFLRHFHPLVSAWLASSLHPLGAAVLLVLGAPVAALFAVLHGAGIGLMTIVKGTLPLALFGQEGFGHRAGWLEAPSRVAQASAPLLFGLALERFGGGALWISFVVALIALVCLLIAGGMARTGTSHVAHSA